MTCRLHPCVPALSLGALPSCAPVDAHPMPSTTSSALMRAAAHRTSVDTTTAGASTRARTFGGIRSAVSVSAKGASPRPNALTTSCRTKVISFSSGIQRTTSPRASRAIVERLHARKMGSGMTSGADVALCSIGMGCRRGTRHLQLLPGGGGVKSLQAPRTLDRSEAFFVTRQVSLRGSDVGR